MKAVSVLVTCDIHTHTHAPQQVHDDLQQTQSILRELNIPCTFFFPADSVKALPQDACDLQRQGHEIGCHGLTHEASENYSLLPLSQQRRLLTQATEEITRILGTAPAVFRAPAFKVSGSTFQILEELGYQADLSINSQRLGIFGSDIYQIGPLLAPRRPYHPSWRNPYRKGKTRLWEIPVSAFGLPFVSNTERLFGLKFASFFFRFLYREARFSGKPIVFVLHPEDLNGNRNSTVRKKNKWSWKHFIPSRTYGFEFRNHFFESDWMQVQADVVALLRTMSSARHAQFLTASEYLELVSGPGFVTRRRRPESVPRPSDNRRATDKEHGMRWAARCEPPPSACYSNTWLPLAEAAPLTPPGASKTENEGAARHMASQ